jgi:hypothetical protein
MPLLAGPVARRMPAKSTPATLFSQASRWTVRRPDNRRAFKLQLVHLTGRLGHRDQGGQADTGADGVFEDG